MGEEGDEPGAPEPDAAGATKDAIVSAAAHSGSGAGERTDRFVTQIERAKQAALRLLSVRMRSRWELRFRLAGRRFPAEALECALRDLERVGLVDDAKFARLFLESRLRRRPRSYRILSRELHSKGVSGEIIEAAVAEMKGEVSEADLARRALGLRLKRTSDMSRDEARAHAERYLVGKGFSRSLIEEILSDSWAGGAEEP